jgi:plasmid stabilization system protein ParE
MAQSLAQAAERWFNGFVKTLVALETSPRRYGRAREQRRFPCELRQLLYGTRRSHRAVFTMRENKVVVLTIRHTAQKDLKPEDLLSDDGG